MMRFCFHFVLLALMLAPNFANAQLVSAFVRERSGTLPRGRFLVSLVSVNASVDSQYGQDGVSKPLSNNLNQNISFAKIAREEPVRGNQLAGLFRSNGVALEDSAGSLSGSITGNITGKIPVIGYGITDKLGVYVSIPVLNFHLSARYRFNQSPSTSRLLNTLSNSDQKSTAGEISRALDTSLEHKLYDNHYAWTPELNKTYLGDVQITLLQTLAGNDEQNQWHSLQPILILPTATGQELQDLYGLRAGNSRLGVGLKYAREERLARDWAFNFACTGSYLFANQQARRLPRDSDDDLNELYDENARVSGGAQLQSQLQARYEFPRWVGLNLGLQWQRQFQENIEGNAYAQNLYALASAHTDRELLTSYASVDINSIKSFTEGRFLFPALAELGIGIPLRGRNSISEPVIELQGSLFF